MQNVEANHHCLSQRQVKDMYKQLGRSDASLVSPLILRPIAYLVAERDVENKIRGSYLLEENMQSGSSKVLSSHMGI